MPPRKGKVQKETIVNETPIIFFLRISEDYLKKVDPANAVEEYSEILNEVENTKNAEHFNVEILKSILDTLEIDRYSPQTSCFWCCHTFGWPSVVLPISYDAYKNVYKCEGNFCSPECALAYNYADPKISDSTRWNKHSLLGHLYSILYENKVLSPAPPRSILRMFGGPLDIKQFRDYISSTNDIVISDISPIRLYFPSMNVQGPIRDIKKYVSLSQDDVEKASEQLRLKRTRTANVNIPTLDMCLRPTSILNVHKQDEKK